MHNESSYPRFGNLTDNNFNASGNGTEWNFHSNIIDSGQTFHVFLIRIGFLLIQIGAIPIENIYSIILQNIVDIALTIISFAAIGYTIAFGESSLAGLFGFNSWIGSNEIYYDEALLGFSACIVGTGIITTMLAGRLHFAAYSLTTIVYSGFVQPLIMHWIWHQNGWLVHSTKFGNNPVAIIDHSGGIVIHFTAGLTGFIGTLVLGRRLIKLISLNECSIGVESPGSCFIGYILIIIGLMTLPVLTNSLENSDVIAGKVLMNYLLSLSVFTLIVILLNTFIYKTTKNYWLILRCMQGSVAGLVAISAGIGFYNNLITIIISVLLSLLFVYSSIQVNFSAIEDYCNMVSVHLICGFFGSMVVHLFDAYKEGFMLKVINTLWQLLGCIIIFILIFIIFYTLFTILRIMKILRNEEEMKNHRLAILAANNVNDRFFLRRLFRVYKDTPYLEPGNLYRNPNYIENVEKFATKLRKEMISP